MRVVMWISLGLGLFLAVAGTVYATTAYEWRGAVLLLVCAVAFLYVGIVLRGAFRRASAPGTQGAEAEEGPIEPEHVGPTIWPFVFSIAALLLVVGVVGIRWVLIPGAILFLGAGAGWFRDIERQKRHHGPAAGDVAGGVSALDGQQHTDHDDRR